MLGLFFARTQSAAPALEAPLWVLLEPLRGDLLSLNEAAHGTRDIDRRLFFVTNTRTTGQAHDKNECDHYL